MSKRNIEGDVIYNKVAVGHAGEEHWLAAQLGLKIEKELENESPNDVDDDDEDLKEHAVDDETFGVGARIPKDIEDGSFTRRVQTSDDKLLQQLIGKKAAKAHLAARQPNSRTGSKQQKYTKPTPAPKEESDDEEEGRASAFKSKKRNVKKSMPKPTVDEEVNGADERPQDAPESELPIQPASNDTALENVEEKTTRKRKSSEDGVDGEESKGPSSRPRSQKLKPASYLDEILAERSKKKKKKNKPKTDI